MRLQDVKRYQRTRLLLALSGSVFFLVYAGMWSWWGGSPLLNVSDHRWLGLLVFGGVFGFVHEVLTLPLNFVSDFIVEHRFGQSNQTLSRWLGQLIKGWCIGGLISGIVLAGVYACLWYAGPWWWLWVWVSWILLSVVLAQLFPVLLLPVFYKSRLLDDPELAGHLMRLAEGSGFQVQGIYCLDLSTDTKAANALLTGLGSTRRVYLSDTLLEAFSAGEIMVVFAHELGHHVRKHIWKTLILSAVFASLNIAILGFFLGGYGAAEWRPAVAALPTCALAIALIGVLVRPIHNAVSRHFERQCDSDALHRTRDPHAYRSAFNRLAEMNLADPDPHPLIEWYFHDHPAMSKRLALADQFEACGT